ncbi:hypothetical protein CL652_01515 [bacterium]|nr:hypothetical protein [bacterium]|tara:strand:+ start:3173 stop:3601 length:429 start_codon:yes stop_codon:yes gene_type:complete
MVNVSKRQLPEKVENELIKQLSALIVAQQNTRESRNLIFDLFTPAERVVFIKRVGIIALIQRGYSHNAISEALHVSDTTVAKVANDLDRGKYAAIAATLERREYRESILGILESLITFGFNPQQRLRKQIRKDIESWRAGSK